MIFSEKVEYFHRCQAFLFLYRNARNFTVFYAISHYCHAGSLIYYAAVPVGSEVERSFQLESIQMEHTRS